MTPLRRKTRLKAKGRLRSTSARTRGAVALSRKWAVEVKTRDGCCVSCGSVDLLEAHHVYPKGKYPDLRLVPENGLTLCRGCHRKWHASSRAWRVWWETVWYERAEKVRSLIRAS